MSKRIWDGPTVRDQSSEVTAPEPDPAGLAAARTVAGYELGDPTWADIIIGAYLYPAGARRVYFEAFRED